VSVSESVSESELFSGSDRAKTFGLFRIQIHTIGAQHSADSIFCSPKSKQQNGTYGLCKAVKGTTNKNSDIGNCAMQVK
jgi:hypothetical protein